MSEDMWHVQIEPGEIKTVTLEQLDDMYRLELISASTLVWQPGMPKALPLSVIAGIEDDEEDEVMEIEPELIPEAAYSVPAPAYPPVATSTYPSASAYPPAVAAYPPAVAPAAVAERQATMTPPPASTNAMASVAPAPQMPAPDFYSPESLRPITMSHIPDPGLRPAGRGGRIVMGIAIAAGLLITLHRNDLLRPMASSAGSEAAYDKIQAALGSPGFGTTQSVVHFSKMLNPPELETSTDTSVTPPTTSTTESTSADDSESSTDSDSATDTSASTTTTNETAHDENTKPKHEAKTTAPRSRSVPVRRKSSSAPSGKPLKSYKGSEYDPMNAKL